MTTITKAVVYNPDKTLNYRQEHEWAVLSPTVEAALLEGVDKQRKFLEDMKKQQGNKTPDAVFHATMSCTGQADISFSEFTFDMYQKACHAWNVMLEELFRLQEKEYKAAQAPAAPPPGQVRPKP